jgi:radical SAM enzyme (TIGR01210 family)
VKTIRRTSMKSTTGSKAAAPEALWKEDDLLQGNKVRAMVVIFRTTGCWWSRKAGCLMCGYNQVSDSNITVDDLRAQLQGALARYEGEKLVKIYTSGSFLDDREVPPEVREEIFESFAASERVLFESRPEFVTDESLQALPKGKAQVALGFESANDEVLLRSVRKGFKTADYEKAARCLMDKGVPLRTYLLLKPPYLTERQAMDDTIRSIRFAAPFSESVSINPLNVQRDTVVESLFRRGDFRPPWIWSLIEVLKAGKGLTDVRVFSSPSGGGTPRGVHNCGTCDAALLKAVDAFSFSQDVKEFDGLECGCRERWKAQLEVQDAMRTAVDIDRHLADELPLD